MRYEPAAKNVPPGRCQTGTRALGLAIAKVWPEFISLRGGYGCYSYRAKTSGPGWSLHAEGRALDIGVPSGTGQLGWQLACELVAHRVVYGVQRVVWDKHIWTVERIDTWHRLQPTTQQHTDHIHVEQYWHAALRSAAFQDPYEEALTKARYPDDVATGG